MSLSESTPHSSEELHTADSNYQGIRLGRNVVEKSEFGFHAEHTVSDSDQSICYDDEGHLMTVAPTGKGKGVCSVIPTLLEYPGSVIVFDPKGENYQVTVNRRKELGQRVVVLNPFQILCDETDSLNPLDLLQLPGADIESDAQMLASMLSSEGGFSKDPFWDISGSAILSGIIAHLASWDDEPKRTLNQLHQWMHQDDVAYQLAVLLDTCGKQMNQFAYREIAAFLQHPERETRPSVQSTAASYLKCLAGGRVPDVLKHSSFSLEEFVNGEPVSIYIIIPPNKLKSHRGLFRLLIGTLLAAVMTRENRPMYDTLFLVDEAAQLKQFTMLEQALTLCRGYGLKVWSFWQDLAQLKTYYPESWRTLMNNCDIKQIYGISSLFQARDWGTILERSPEELLKIAPTQQLLVMPNGDEIITEKLNYLHDADYQRLALPNPRYTDFVRERKRPEKLSRPVKPGTDETNEEVKSR